MRTADAEADDTDHPGDDAHQGGVVGVDDAFDRVHRHVGDHLKRGHPDLLRLGKRVYQT